ncbi:AcrR family transcriptional regulator [Mycolicibacterium sp. BK556]|uniref:TetR/AcrR family transcriptional regulator n=1 Tax=Mycobacteriaceae TaxID=1762 RepID=UPI00180954DA|nr:TetR/AcrR family transcriptional regulator [Mycobacterium sp. BK086]MBB3600647.1 AcrR family transcriptional regulator [Mycolicibacterium sp. BK556]MBB3630400.1 AcrR family transcriptional regulator [Mycolicibacterium sp. BK607]MBB3748399.1 AcrR family transcriptional regulator [Mycolicibacterium sp. BK634]
MIDLDAVADAVAGLVIDGGEKAISIVGAAERLDVSRATLYRLVPTKEDLVGIMFERATRQQTEVMSDVVDSEVSVRDKLIRLIGMQVEAAVRMRGYMPVFFGGEGLPADVFERWHAWSRDYEATWRNCVEEAMAEGVLEQADVGTTTRLLLGMCLWVSRWYRPEDGFEIEDIARVAVSLVLPEGA